MKENIMKGQTMKNLNNDTMPLDSRVKHENDRRGLENGRSMVEMLGVLAIVGVLSIGGITGYSYGMDKYRANETINDVMLRAADLITQIQQTGTPNLIAEWGDKGTFYPINLIWDDGEKQYGLVVDNVPSRVCQIMGEGLKSMATVYIGDSNFEVNPDACDSSDSASMEFYFKATSASNLECKTDNECSSEEVCINGLCNFKRSLVITEYRGKNTICEVDDDCGPCGWCDTWAKTCGTRYNGTSCTVDNKDGQCFLGECFPKGCDDNTPCKGRNEYCASPLSSSVARFQEGEQGTCVEADFQKYPIDGTDYYVSTTTMSWWDAESACQVIGKKMVSAKYLVTEENGSEWKGNTGSYSVSETARELATYFNVHDGVWTKEIIIDVDHMSVGGFVVNLKSANVWMHALNHPDKFALCH